MMARISCSRTSKEMSVSALTPPKASEMFCTSRITSPKLAAGRRGAGGGAALDAARGRRMIFMPRPSPARRCVASMIFSVALTLPVRPSSNFTWVSMYCSVLPPYSASTSTWYFSAMKPRRTLLVRVSSPSSASSSLCSTRKRLICAAGQLVVGGQVGVDLLHAILDQLVDLGLLRQVGVAGIGQVAPLGPVAHGVEVDVDHHADLLAPVAIRPPLP